jgi:predicted Fe-S protein YdhL (DUF1289 family)
MSVASPCISVCKIDPKTGWCEGCRRNLDEIRRWPRMTDEQKLAVLDDLKTRPAFPINWAPRLMES